MAILDQKQKMDLVIALLNEGKTYREIPKGWHYMVVPRSQAPPGCRRSPDLRRQSWLDHGFVWRDPLTRRSKSIDD